jgi:hypothetical protein
MVSYYKTIKLQITRKHHKRQQWLCDPYNFRAVRNLLLGKQGTIEVRSSWESNPYIPKETAAAVNEKPQCSWRGITVGLQTRSLANNWTKKLQDEMRWILYSQK